MNQLQPLASLAVAAVITVFNSLAIAEIEAARPAAGGFTRALRIIESVETVKKHADSARAFLAPAANGMPR